VTGQTTSPGKPTGYFKSSFSGASGCVEVAFVHADEVRVRDSKVVGGAELTFNRTEWVAFLAGVRGGEFELPA
jgi:hypothetical protein